MRLEVGQRGHVEGASVRRVQPHLRRASGAARLLPAADTEAPRVAGLQAGEAVLGRGGGEVVPARGGELEELPRHYGADRVRAAITGVGAAAAIAEVPGDRVGAADGQGGPQNVLRLR